MYGIRKSLLKVPLKLWMTGVFLGVICAMVISDAMGRILKEYLQVRLQSEISMYAWLRCLWINGRFMVLLGVITYMPYAVVWIQTAMAAYGFFFGFSIQILARAYGLPGIAGALISYIPHNLFLLPVIVCVVLNIEERPDARNHKLLWICIIVMAVLSTYVEIRTAPLLMQWCLEGMQ